MNAKLLPTAGEILFQQLRDDLDLLDADVAWVREEARDTALLNFFHEHGFRGGSPYQTP
jgi:hypothetical protein